MDEGANNQGNGGDNNAQKDVCEQLRPPTSLDCTTDTLARLWKPWRDEVELYLELAHANKQEGYKIKMLKYLLGVTGRQIYETLHFATPEPDRTLEEVLNAFDILCNPEKNETVERYQFFTRYQKPGEAFEAYNTALKVLAATCNFAELNDSLTRDMIIIGLHDKQLQELLLRTADLDLKKCTKMCRTTEITKEHAKAMEPTSDVHYINRRKKERSQSKKSYDTATSSHKPTSYNKTTTMRKCKYCDNPHKFGADQCPAYGKKCKKCGKMNHFSEVCKFRNIHGICTDNEEEYESDETTTSEYEEIQMIDVEELPVNNMKETSATIMIGRSSKKQQEVIFEIDSGAHCNIIPERYLKEIEHHIKPTKKRLRMYNKEVLEPVGITRLKFTNPKNSKKYIAEFVVVAEEYLVPIIGRETAIHMKLMEIKAENILAINDNKEQPMIPHEIQDHKERPMIPHEIPNHKEQPMIPHEIPDHKNTPTEGLNTSPAQRLMCRRTQYLLPMTPKLLKPKVPEDQSPQMNKKKKAEITRYNNSRAKNLKTLTPGDTVRIQPTDDKKKSEWRKAKVLKQLSERSYEVKTQQGTILRRNRRHLRFTKEQMQQNRDYSKPNQIEWQLQKQDQPEFQLRKPIQDEQPPQKPSQAEQPPRKPKPIQNEQPPQKPNQAEQPPRKPKPSLVEQQPDRPDQTNQQAELPIQPDQKTRAGRTVRKPSRLKDYTW